MRRKLNVEPKRGGVLNVEGVESKIERGLTSKRLGSVEVTLGKMADMMEKFINNISQLQELSFSVLKQKSGYAGYARNDGGINEEYPNDE